MVHIVSPMCTCDEDTPWILVVSWSHISPHLHAGSIIKRETRWHGYMEADGAHYKWPGVAEYAHGTNIASYEHAGLICIHGFSPYPGCLSLSLLRIQNKNKHHQPPVTSITLLSGTYDMHAACHANLITPRKYRNSRGWCWIVMRVQRPWPWCKHEW